MAVTRRVKRQRPSAFDRILQIIGTGVRVAGTVEGIKASKQRRSLLEQQNELLAQKAEKDLFDESVEAANGARFQRGFDLVNKDPAERNAFALKALNAVSQIGGGLGALSEQTENSAFLVAELLERNRLVDLRRAGAMMTTALTVDQINEPLANQTIRKVVGRRLGVAPEDVPGNYVLSTDQANPESIFNAQSIEAILGAEAQNPGMVGILADLKIARELFGENVPIGFLAAKNMVRGQIAGEFYGLVRDGNPDAISFMAQAAGIPEPPDVVLDLTAEDLAKWHPGLESNLPDGGLRWLMNKKDLMPLFRADVAQNIEPRPDRVQALTEQVGREMASALTTAFGGVIDNTGIAQVANGCASDYGLATASEEDGGCGISMSFEQWSASPRWNIMRAVDNQFAGIRQLATASGMIGNAEQVNSITLATQELQRMKWDPTVTWGRNLKRNQEHLRAMNDVMEAAGQGRPYAIPSVEGGIYHRRVQWVLDQEKAGAINTQQVISPSQMHQMPDAAGGTVQPPTPEPGQDLTTRVAEIKTTLLAELETKDTPQAREAFLAVLEARTVGDNGPPFFQPEEIQQVRDRIGLAIPAEEAAIAVHGPPEPEVSEPGVFAGEREAIAELGATTSGTFQFFKNLLRTESAKDRERFLKELHERTRRQ